nr:hypothetical protein [Candidatus Freyarchaeota archaeon]
MGLVFGSIGITLGALLIIIGNLATVYMAVKIPVEMTLATVFEIPRPNFLVIWTGFMIMGFIFIPLGSANIDARYLTNTPSASNASRISSVIGAIIFPAKAMLYYYSI